MNEVKLRTIAQLQEFLNATPEITFTAAPSSDSDQQRYDHISRVLTRFGYTTRGKADRGVVLEYLRRTSGYSRSQLTRLVARWLDNRAATVPLSKRYGRPAAPFARKYTGADVALLAEMDRANEDVCGPAIVHLLQRAFGVYGDPRYEHLSKLSYRTCTTCARAAVIGPREPTSPRHEQSATRLGCARLPGPMGVRAGCASTACTKAT